MKFAFCLFNYFPYGGLQRDFLRIAKQCVQRGHHIDVFTMDWQAELDPHLAITILPKVGWQNHTQARHFVKQLKPHLKNKDYDLIVGFNKMPGLDVYYAADTCYQAKAKKQRGPLYRLTSRYRHLVHYETAVFSQENHTQILLISPQQQAEFMHHYQTPEKRFHLLPPGIEKDRIAALDARATRIQTRNEFLIKNEDFLLLMVGSGFKTKGLDRILIAVSALPENIKKRSHLFIIGKNSTKPFQKQAAQLGISHQVHFLGGRDDVPCFLLAADLLLHPAYNENTGTVLLEALVAGLPVLTTDVCGYAHYIQESQAGIVLSSPFQQNQFNTVLVDMLSSPLHSRWRMNGLCFAKEADIYSMPERAVDKLEHFASLKR